MIVVGVMILVALVVSLYPSPSDPTQGHDDPPCICDLYKEKFDCDGECLNKPNLNDWPPCRCSKALRKCDFNCKHSNDL
jgi:hypothetical protein